VLQAGSRLVSFPGFAQASMQQLLPSLDVPPISPRWLQTEQQAFESGQVYDSYFATEEGWKRFRLKGRAGLISYRRLGKYVKVLGGLLADDEEKPLHLFASSFDLAHNDRAVPNERSLDFRFEESQPALRPEPFQGASAPAACQLKRIDTGLENMISA
jgi:hypothetical protein